MSSYEEAIAAKEKFKSQFWSKDPDKFNIIGIDCTFTFDENTIDEDESVVIDENYFVIVYLFDVNDANDFPKIIDNVEIKYFSTVEN